jgi:hypothetical protein
VSEAAQYVGDTTLVGSVLKLVRARGVVAHVSFLDPVPPGEASRRALAHALQDIVAARLAHDLAR